MTCSDLQSVCEEASELPRLRLLLLMCSRCSFFHSQRRLSLQQENRKVSEDVISSAARWLRDGADASWLVVFTVIKFTIFFPKHHHRVLAWLQLHLHFTCLQLLNMLHKNVEPGAKTPDCVSKAVSNTFQ